MAGNYDGTSSGISNGGNNFECAKDNNDDWITPRYVSSQDDVNLFIWYKNDVFCSYTVNFIERDSNTNTEMWEVCVQIISKAVSAIWAGNVLVMAIAEILDG